MNNNANDEKNNTNTIDLLKPKLSNIMIIFIVIFVNFFNNSFQLIYISRRCRNAFARTKYQNICKQKDPTYFFHKQLISR